MRKLATIGLSVATVLSLTGAGALAPLAGADTISDLQAQITALQAQLSALMGGGSSSTTCYVWNGSLTLGSTGPDVTTLQNYLTGTGHFTFSGGATGYFGPITQAAVAAWQAANGVAPAVGYFGPISQAKYNTLCGTPAEGEGSTGTTGLSGGAGSVDYRLLSDWSGEEVGEDADDVKVAGIEVEPNGSDVEFNAVRVNFDVGTADQDFDEYASEVSVWLDGEEVGRVDADQFNDDNAFQYTIGLDSGTVVEEDEKAKLAVAVSGAKNIDSNNVTETWTVDFTQVRWMDATDASVSEDPGTGTRTFSFETAATASDVELHITAADNDAVNKAHLIDVHATENTRTTILDFELENSGDSDLEYKEFGALLTGSATDLDTWIAGGTSPQVYLVLDGTEYGTASWQDDADGISIGTAEDVLWDDVNFTHSAGETVSGQIEIVIRGIDEDPALGDTIFATLGETETDQTALVDVRDESNTQLADADITGAVTGVASEIRDVGFDLTLVGTPTAVKTDGNASTGTSDSVEYTITFDVKAWGGDIFIDNDNPTRATATTHNVTTSVSTGTLSADVTTVDATEGTNSFTVLEGQTERFSIIGRVADGATDDLADGYLDFSLSTLRYALSNISGNLSYTLNLGAFKTPSRYLDDLE
ncbi:peptidoglycan-binding protein [Patescibacteria group bacterium]|nr:peptidoglycan-binding protein [Patescibacteria group bacterium]